MDIKIRKIDKKDKPWIKKVFITNWGSNFVITRGKVYYSVELDGFIAEVEGKRKGLITYNIKNGNLEIVSLISFIKNKGIGTLLISMTMTLARQAGVKRIWLITTNDNIDALKFYQKRGFKLIKVYPDAVSVSRKLKPGIPVKGNYNIPIRDEIELEARLK